MEKYRETSKQAYQQMLAVTRHQPSEPFEIEILPSALIAPDQANTIQRDGRCIGVPKKLLAIAYLRARDLFFSLRSSNITAQAPVLLEATALMLYFDPEIPTAANYRKRLLIAAQPSALPELLRSELHLLDSLLTSPLHRHTKSPTLWSHRHWLIVRHWDMLLNLRRQGAEQRGAAQTDSVTLAETTWFCMLRPELGVIHAAGARHPMNYYAFDYARRLFQGWTDTVNEQVQTRVLQYMLSMHFTYCVRHPGDTSAWSFLGWLLRKDGPRLADSLVEDSLVRTIQYRWRQESVWVFLRTALAEPGVLSPGHRTKLMQQVLVIVESGSDTGSTIAFETEKIDVKKKLNTEFIAAARKALTWIDRHTSW